MSFALSIRPIAVMVHLTLGTFIILTGACSVLAPKDSDRIEATATEFPVYTTTAPAPVTATPFNSPIIAIAPSKATEAQTPDTPDPQSKPDLVTGTYRVEAGDTLSGISKKFQITIEEIRKLNPEQIDDNIFVGQILTIKPLVSPTMSAVTASPTAYAPLAPSPVTDLYLVKAGDAAILIAEDYGITFEDLQTLNPEVDLSTIFIGQALNVPK